jgi:hypothetical protein
MPKLKWKISVNFTYRLQNLKDKKWEASKIYELNTIFEKIYSQMPYLLPNTDTQFQNIKPYTYLNIIQYFDNTTFSGKVPDNLQPYFIKELLSEIIHPKYKT